MKVAGIVLKVLAVLLAVAAIAYVIIAYGDKIKAWGQNLFRKFTGRRNYRCDGELADNDFAGC